MKSSKHWLDRPILEGKRRRYKGSIGVELEIEGTMNFGPSLPVFWSWKEEHSLRGGVEFVLNKPLDLPDLQTALTNLEETLSKSNLQPTIRCSTHLHVNVSHLTSRQIYQALAYYFLIEDLLVRTQGPLRIGNLFCLRMSDSEFLAYELMMSLETGDGFNTFSMDSHKYGACNLAAVRKFGSLEFRFFRPLKTQQIFFWAKLLNRLVDRAKDFPPQKLLQMVEDNRYLELLKLCLEDEEIAVLLSSTQPGASYQQLIDTNYELVSKMARLLSRSKRSVIPRHVADIEYDGDLNLLNVNAAPPGSLWSNAAEVFPSLAEDLPEEFNEWPE